jgi:hypothetical protein
MRVRDIKTKARAWVEANAASWPGLRAAHFVGGITSQPDEAAFPSYKDVDFHLVFDDDSPMLVPTGPFAHLIETEYDGLIIEAGPKPASDYADPANVLANPEIAHHLTLEPIVYDPDGMLARLQPTVRREYDEPRWIDARLDHERRGLAGAMAMLDMSRGMYGVSGELNILGYSFTFAGAMLDIASLQAPGTGSGFPLRMERTLVEHGRPDLYDEFLEVMGVANLSPAIVQASLARASEAFDVAVTIKKTPVPFQHKLNAHMKPYFVESCRTLIESGRHREAANWLSPYFTSCVDVIKADGTDEQRARFIPMIDAYFGILGKDTEAGRTQHIERAIRLHADIEDVAKAIAREDSLKVPVR